MENRIVGASNQAHLTLPAGMAEFDDTIGLIAEYGDGDQPTAYHLA